MALSLADTIAPGVEFAAVARGGTAGMCHLSQMEVITCCSLAATVLAICDSAGLPTLAMASSGLIAAISTFACQLLDDDVARKHRADLILGNKCLMGQGRIARPQNPVGAKFDIELGLHRCGNVDFGKRSEAVALQRCRSPHNRIVECAPSIVLLDSSSSQRLFLRFGGRTLPGGQK